MTHDARLATHLHRPARPYLAVVRGSGMRPGGQQDVVKYATVSFAKPDRDDMALRQYGATIDRPDGLAICAHPRSREAKRDRELIVDR